MKTKRVASRILAHCAACWACACVASAAAQSEPAAESREAAPVAAPVAEQRLFVLSRLTFIAPGTLTTISTCEGDGCKPNMLKSRDAEDGARNAAFDLGLELLFRVGKFGRLGLGLDAQVTAFTVEGKGQAPDLDPGQFLRVPLIGELRIRASDVLAFPVRAFGGLNLFFPASDLRDSLEAVQERCQDVAGCDADGPMGVGIVVGGGVGVAYDLGDLGVRGDLLVGFDWVRLQAATFDQQDAVLTTALSGLVIAPSFAIEL